MAPLFLCPNVGSVRGIIAGLLRAVRFGVKAGSSIFVLSSTRASRTDGVTTMSPFCLIDVTSIRDDANHSHESGATWHARLAEWIGRLFQRPHT